MKKTRRIVSMIICIAMLMSMCLFSGCSGQGSAEGAFKAYMKAQEEADVNTSAELIPPAYINHYVEGRMEKYGYTREEAKKSVYENYSPMSLNVDALKINENYDPATECKYTYDIIDTKSGSSAQVKEVNNYVKNKFGFDLNADKITVIKYKYSIKSKSGLLDRREEETYGVSFKIDGKWYYADSNLLNEKLWVSQSGLLISDGVTWILDYVGKSYSF